MKVYVVTYGQGNAFEGVFSTPEKAQEFIDREFPAAGEMMIGFDEYEADEDFL